MGGFLVRLRRDLRTVRADEIARRYFVLNAFDGALTTLGIIMGSYFTGLAQARLILSAGVAGSAAMGMSGAFGAYMSERAERARSIRELEKALFSSLEDSVLESASKRAVLMITLIDALSPFVVSLLCLSPLFLALIGLVNLTTAITASFVVVMVVLFSLGAFLGRLSRTSVLFNGGLTTLAGMLIMLFVYLIGTR